ncbi:MAG: amylo-alpha-1,6-glucosidase, partial [Phycisphaerales bacterium]
GIDLRAVRDDLLRRRLLVRPWVGLVAVLVGHDEALVLLDGLGGFAMGSVSGVPMRRYHGVLCASLSPPVCRAMLLNAVDELVHIPQGGNCGCDLDVRLTGFQFPDQDPPIENPYLTEFVKTTDSCRWTFSIPSQLGRVHIRKTLTIADRLGGVRVEYEIESGIDSDLPITIELRPLVSMRDFHALNYPGSLESGHFQTQPISEPAVQGVAIRRDGFDPTLSIRGIQLAWASMPSVWRGISYQHDALRQQDHAEDLYCPGVFSSRIERSEIKILSIEATIAEESTTDWGSCSAAKRTRVRSASAFALDLAGDPQDHTVRDAIVKLAKASDDFIVQRGKKADGSVSVLAGYPWFSDWGRDTMIALPGLFLCTGRFDEAYQTLRTFGDAIKDGLIPNRFDDADGDAHYNTVDASLWFIHACDQWARASGRSLDSALVRACDTILDAYIAGTISRIGLDPEDGLIAAGDEHTQLTWMDALRDGKAFTPRHGKAIEINALWVHALEIRGAMAGAEGVEGGENIPARPELIELAAQARRSIEQHMGQGPGGGLVDCIWRQPGVRTTALMKSQELRPNQIFAVSLEGVGLSEAIARRSIDAVGQTLLTPVGLRTLEPAHVHYCAHYQGSMTDRDNAYHNGTAWPWLLGGYCEALMRVNGFDEPSRKEARAIMLGLVSKMESDSVGQLFEIYDAEPIDGRHRPQGCMAQAWSIAEALRVLVMSCQP